MSEPTAWGAGLAWTTRDGRTLDWWCPDPRLGGPPPEKDPWPGEAELAALRQLDSERQMERQVRRVTAVLDEPPTSPADAYLRLQLLSHRLVKPNELNLDGIFGLLENVAWTSVGPCAADTFERTRPLLELVGRGPVRVYGVDKLPAMTDYVIPSGVRIADSSRVRLGAYLAPGTTVMQEGFINFNAGTLGESMIEGRVSQGVVIGAGADVGGGASIMGTLSGGGSVRISVGPRSLIGANAGIGISLGADCVVEAGLYITAGTKVAVTGPPSAVPSAAGPQTRLVKAIELSGLDGLLFRRNSVTGTVEAIYRPDGIGTELNSELHAN
ncbi:MAG: 2,3,4,5-tetrahydropyridine-2,6-dicarboxylate N-succinyltransferase [Bifidobacteriaceae bacterium]|jgi:2,3,4,5-tetrahydropyridine-2-carboxylate N-succinyltransferase|nr:2,3,4,5-tetrahydropyridine-2,6-dicarboxylate N-succinyltransferase [Bifidobacteriaceae bacterium]